MSKGERGQDTFSSTTVPPSPTLGSSAPVSSKGNTFILEPTIPSATIRSDLYLEAHEKCASECTSVHDVGNEPLATHGPVSKNQSTPVQRPDTQKAISADGVLGRGVGVERSVLRANTLSSLRRGEPLDLSRSRSGVDWIVPAVPTQFEKKVESENHS